MLPLSIYIHWPFCKSKCPYCDFNSHVRDSVKHARWRDALLKELSYYAALMPGREVVSIFFGGGTPSLMEAETVAALIEAASRHWAISDTIEITLEANPTSVEAGKLQAFRAAGVNRVSLGVQALNAQDLKFLGRHHSADEALKAVALARDIFPRMSFDLIYARPTQTLASWEEELTKALPLTKGHMSLYQLTIEENTAFHAAQQRGELPVIDDDTAADMYALTAQIMEAHGMPAYEISNYAKPGEESRHNLTYWRGDDYLGIGPGAHGRYKNDHALFNGGNASPIGASRQFPRGVVMKDSSASPRDTYFSTENIKSPERWLEKVEKEGQGLSGLQSITPAERAGEMLMMGLRLNSGISFSDWQDRTGVNIREAINNDALQQMVAGGFLLSDNDRLLTTPKGALMLSSVTGALLS